VGDKNTVQLLLKNGADVNRYEQGERGLRRGWMATLTVGAPGWDTRTRRS
jgi:hypothetical protein